MAQKPASLLEDAWAEVEQAQSLESAWAEVESAKKPTGRKRSEPPGAIGSGLADLLKTYSAGIEGPIQMVSDAAKAGREALGLPFLPGLTAPWTDLRGMRAEEAGAVLEAAAPSRPKQATSFLGQVAEAAPGALGSTLAGLTWAAAGGPLAAAAGLGTTGTAALTGAGSGAFSSAGTAYQDTLRRTGNERKAWAAAGWNALLGLTEAADTVILAGFGKALKPAKEKALRTLRQKIVGLLGDAAKGVGVEATQEAFQQAGQVIIDRKLTGAEHDLLREVGVAAILGGVMGGVMGASGATVRAAMWRSDGATADAHGGPFEAGDQRSEAIGGRSEPTESAQQQIAPEPSQQEQAVLRESVMTGQPITAAMVQRVLKVGFGEASRIATKLNGEIAPLQKKLAGEAQSTETPFQAKIRELQDVSGQISEIEARNRGQRASTEDIQTRLDLLKRQQQIALEVQEAAAGERAAEPESLPDLPDEARRIIYHGTPHEFEKFDISKIGTGEGAQSFGHGLYFTDKKEIAEHYRNKLAERPTIFVGGKEVSGVANTPGAVFGDKDAASIVAARLANLAHARLQNEASVDPANIVAAVRSSIENGKRGSPSVEVLKSLMDQSIALDRMEREGISFSPRGTTHEVALVPKESELLDWDKPLKDQSEQVRAALAAAPFDDPLSGLTKGYDFYRHFSETMAERNDAAAEAGKPTMGESGNEGAAKMLRSLGIRGIRYKAEGGKSESSNYVIFDDKDVEILKPEPSGPNPLLLDERVRSALQGYAHEAGWHGRGGDVSKPDPITGTRYVEKWVPKAEWWIDRPADSTEKDFKRVVEKVLADPNARLGPKQEEILDWMMNRIERELGEGRYLEDRLAAEREFQADLDRINAPPPVQPNDFEEGSASFDPSSWGDQVREAVQEDLESKGVKGAAAQAQVAADQAVQASRVTGEPPGPPKPPAPPEAMPGPMDEGEPGIIGSREMIERWIGEKQLAHANADIKAAKFRKAIDKTLSGGLGRFLKERFAPRDRRARFEMERAALLAIDTQGKLDQEYGKYGAAIPEKGKAILERAANLSPAQRAIVQAMIENNLKTSLFAQGEDVISDHYDIFTKRLWKGRKDSGESARAKGGVPRFQTFTTGALPRSYSSILEGWAKGDELLLESAVDAAAWNEKVVADVALNRNLIRQGEKAGWLRMVPPPEGGWEQIKHPNFRSEHIRLRIKAPESAEAVRAALEGTLEETIPMEEAIKVYGRAKEGKTSIVAGRDMRIIPSGDELLVMQKVPLYAPKKEAHFINNVLGRSAINEAIEQGGVLGVSADVLNKTGIISKTMATAGIQDNIGYIMASNFLTQPGGLKAFADLATLAPYRRGQKAVEMMSGDLQRLISRGGLQLAPSADIQPFLELKKGALVKKLESMKITGAPARFVTNTYFDLQNFLFTRFVPAYKANFALLELARLRKTNKAKLLSGAITDEALQEAAGQLTNNVFSGQNWQRMGVNPTLMHAFQHGFLAPDRMTSNIRVAADAFRAGATGAAHRAMWGRLLRRYTLLWAASNVAMAAMADDDQEGLPKAFAKRVRENYRLGLRELMGVDVSPLLAKVGRDNPSRLYLQILAQKTEGTDLLNDFFGFVSRKKGVLPALRQGAITGEDFRGRRYTTFDELFGIDERGLYKTTRPGHHYRGEEKGGRLGGQFTSYQSGATPGHLRYEQLPSFLGANAPIPFELRAWVESLQGQTDAWDALLQTLGFRVMAPSENRQKEAGIDLGGNGAIDFDALFKEAVGR